MQIKLGYNDVGELWKPRKFQIEMTNKLKKSRVHACVVHRQAGKTEFGARAIIDFLFRYNKYKNPKALVTMRTADQAFFYYFQRIHDQLVQLPEAIYMKRGGKDTGIRIYLHRPHIGDTASVIFAGIGNAPALKGGTYDFMVLDEMGLYPQAHWEEIFEPMIDARKGKAILTSTMKGRNHFFKVLELAKKEEASGSNYYSHINVPWQDSGVLTADEIGQKIRGAKATGKYYKFLQEYENDPDAAASEEAPFAMKVSEANQSGQFAVSSDHPVITDPSYVNISVDIGKKGNMAAWVWKQDPVDNSVIIFGYDDDYDGLKELVHKIYLQYKQAYHHINIIFPFDVQQPSMLEGKTYLEQLNRFITDNHIAGRVTLHALPKVSVKEGMWSRGLAFWQRCYFYYDGCLEGINKLSGVRFKATDKDGIVTFGKPVDNGNQHAADAFLYLAAAVEENVQFMGKSPKKDYGVVLQTTPPDYRQVNGPDYRQQSGRGLRYAANEAKHYQRAASVRRQRRYA